MVSALPPHSVLATKTTRKGVRALLFTVDVPLSPSRPTDVMVMIQSGRISVNGVVVGSMEKAKAIDPLFDPLDWTWTFPGKTP